MREREVGIVELGLHRREHRLGRLGPVALRLRAGQQQRRRRAGAVVERELREPGAELGVAREHGDAGRLDAERRRHRLAGVEQPAGDAQRVARLAAARSPTSCASRSRASCARSTDIELRTTSP